MNTPLDRTPKRYWLMMCSGGCVLCYWEDKATAFKMAEAHPHPVILLHPDAYEMPERPVGLVVDAVPRADHGTT